MTITPSAATADLTCDEIHTGFDALIKRIAEIAAERDLARQMASQATKDLIRTRDEAQARLAVHDVLVASLRAHIDAKNHDIRQLNACIRELALANEDLQKQRETEQQQRPAEPKPPRRSVFGRRIGNSL
jgi:chromosome segregation ATPase